MSRTNSGSATACPAASTQTFEPHTGLALGAPSRKPAMSPPCMATAPDAPGSAKAAATSAVAVYSCSYRGDTSRQVRRWVRWRAARSAPAAGISSAWNGRTSAPGMARTYAIRPGPVIPTMCSPQWARALRWLYVIDGGRRPQLLWRFMTDAWKAPAVERAEPGLVLGERQALEAWLDFHRETLLFKCAGLSG